MTRYLAPRFWPVHLLTLVGVVAAGWLGSWQYDAWQQRRDAEAADLTRLEPEPLEAVMGPDDPFPGDRVGQPVFFGGEWVPEATVLVSGRIHDGVEGYWVVTPLAITGTGDPALPIVRGWTDDAEAVPAPPTGYAELTAWLQPSEGSGAPDPDPTDDVLPQVRTADLVQRVDQDLYGAFAVVADDVGSDAWPVGDKAINPGTDGLEQARLEQLPDAGRFTALRNLLYALEWWVFGAFAVLLWWRYLLDAHRDEVAAGDRVPSDA